MPTYVYRREDGTTFEVSQRITADALLTCPTTHQKVRRIISGGTGFILKGTGFYQTDYAPRPNGDSAPATEESKAEDDAPKSEEKASDPAAEEAA